MKPQESLFQYLVAEGYITPTQLHRARQTQARQGGDLLQLLVQLNFLTTEKLRQAQHMHARWLQRSGPQGPHPPRTHRETGKFHPALPPTGQHVIVPHTGPYPGPFYPPTQTSTQTSQYSTLGQQPVRSYPPPSGEPRVPPHLRGTPSYTPGTPGARPHTTPQRPTSSEALSANDMVIFDDLEFHLETGPAPSLVNFQPPPTQHDEEPIIELNQMISPPTRDTHGLRSETPSENSILSAGDIPYESLSPAMQTVAMELESGPQEAHVSELEASVQQVQAQDPMQTIATDFSLTSADLQDPMQTIALTESSFSTGTAFASEAPDGFLPPTLEHPPFPKNGQAQKPNQWADDPQGEVLTQAPRQPERTPFENLQGTVLHNRFLIQEREAVGPGFVVYTALDQHTRNQVVVRYMPFYAFIQEPLIQHFVKECNALHSLRHPNLARLLAHGIHRHSGAYLIYQRLKGSTLSAHLYQRTALTLAGLLPLFEVLCDALEHLHRQGLVHRNLRLSSLQWPDASQQAFPTIQLLPTGITPLATSPLTLPWMMALQSTQPMVLCPELNHSPPNALTPASDIYALGLMLFEILAQKPLYQGNSVMHLLQQHQDAVPPTLREACPHANYPDALQRLLSQSLSKQPNQRPNSASTWYQKFVKAVQEAPEAAIPLGYIPQELQELDRKILDQANQLLTDSGYDNPLTPPPRLEAEGLARTRSGQNNADHEQTMHQALFASFARRLRSPRQESDVPSSSPQLPAVADQKPSPSTALTRHQRESVLGSNGAANPHLPQTMQQKEPNQSLTELPARALVVSIVVFLLLLTLAALIMKAYAAPAPQPDTIQKPAHEVRIGGKE